VLLDLIEIQQFKDAEYNPAFVLMQYFGYLRRGPDQGGYDFWLNILNNSQPRTFVAWSALLSLQRSTNCASARQSLDRIRTARNSGGV